MQNSTLGVMISGTVSDVVCPAVQSVDLRSSKLAREFLRRLQHQRMGYWQKYDFYGLLHGCGAAVPAAQLHGLSRDACLQRCSSQWDCHAIAYHQAQAVCRVYMQCDDGELGSRPCAEEWCGYMRATALKTAALNHVETKAGMAGQSRPGWPARPERLIARGWPKPKAWSGAERSLRGASWPKAEPACKHRRSSAPRAVALPSSSCATCRESCHRCPSGPTRTRAR